MHYATLSECPQAFAGYGFDKREGFYVTICKLCPDRVRAKQEWKAFRIQDGLCPAHYQEQLTKRMGEA